MRMNSLCSKVAALVMSAFVVSSVKGAANLAYVIDVASFEEMSNRATILGNILGNPMMPGLLVASCQQSLAGNYARLRPDTPLRWLTYEVDGKVKTVFVAGVAEGGASMLLNHTGAMKKADGSIFLPPNERRQDETYVVYAEDNKIAAFAPSSELARRALKDVLAVKPNSKLMRICGSRKALASIGDGLVQSLCGVVVDDESSGTISLDFELTDKGLAVDGTVSGVDAKKRASVTADALAAIPPTSVMFSLFSDKAEEGSAAARKARQEKFLRELIYGLLARGGTSSSKSVAGRLIGKFARVKGSDDALWSCWYLAGTDAKGVTLSRMYEATWKDSAVRPNFLFGVSLYSFVREVLIPALADVAEGDAEIQYRTLKNSMPVAKPSGGIVVSIWPDGKDKEKIGAFVNADELNNWGGAFTTFMMATLLSK